MIPRKEMSVFNSVRREEEKFEVRGGVHGSIRGVLRKQRGK